MPSRTAAGCRHFVANSGGDVMPGLKTMPFALFRNAAPRLTAAALLLTASVALAGCETTGTGVAQAAPQPAPAPEPMTHTKAAEYCWMATEHGHADLPLDKRADIVARCIKEKMAGQPADLKGRPSKLKQGKPN